MSRKVVIIIAVVAVVGGIILFPKISLYLSSRAETSNSSNVEFFISAQLDANDLAQELQRKGIIDDIDAFVKVAEYKGLNKDNIALGKYVIEVNSQYRTILNGFKLNEAGNGNAEVEVNVTFNNCRDIYQLASKVCANVMIDSTKLVSYLNDEQTLKKYGFSQEQLPALFYRIRTKCITIRMKKYSLSAWQRNSRIFGHQNELLN